MITISTQTRNLIRSTLITTIAVIALMTTNASATNSCDEAKYKQVTARSDWTRESHTHLDLACPHDYRAISCDFDMHGQGHHDRSKFFVAIQDANPTKFGSNHNGHRLDYRYGCHFRANNFAAYFPGHPNYEWSLKGTATCVPKSCVDQYDTHNYYDDSFDSTWYPDWDGWHH